MGLWPTIDLLSTSQESGVRQFTLGFIQAKGHACTPAWFGLLDVASEWQKPHIQAFRALGGDVVISFGGAAGISLSEACATPEDMTAALRQVIDHYDVYRFDIDFESSAIYDGAGVARFAAAVATLQGDVATRGKKLEVSLTLPVLPDGLTEAGLNVVRVFHDAGADVALVNVMTMNYGLHASPVGRMGHFAIEAATATKRQLAAIYGGTDAELWSRIGVTPMIGKNDLTNEVFTVADARLLYAFAVEHDIGRLSMWSVQRDQACSSPSPAAAPPLNTCHDVSAPKWAFTQAFIGGEGQGIVAPPPTLTTTVVITSEWEGGYCADVRVMNTSFIPASTWSVTFPFAGRLAEAWDTSMRVSGGTARAKNLFYNGEVLPGATVTFGFCARR